MLHPIPPEAFAELERVRAERLAKGLAGHVTLRIDEAPDRPPAWRIIEGETVVASSNTTRSRAS